MESVDGRLSLPLWPFGQSLSCRCCRMSGSTASGEVLDVGGGRIPPHGVRKDL